ncbi:CinA family protein [Luteococcus sp. Sow4_B9]|uniref:CinA family protein n=1 Tax=Luteococcus sp. Sow4_B9 TaxID=3438792 RepID=UPI003F9B3B57
MPAPWGRLVAEAGELLGELERRGLTLGTCESLTGGGLAAAITSVPGASKVFRGALVTYASDLKCSLAGVSARQVAELGVVNEATVAAMATGAQKRLQADMALACSGVAGPAWQDGQPPGTVWVAVAGPGQGPIRVECLRLGGGRAEIRCDTGRALIRMARDLIGEFPV